MKARTVGICILVATLTGCGDKTTFSVPQPQPKYQPSSTPLNVLENLRRAYTTRDSMGYDSLFDASYVGTSTDASGPGPVVLTFTKADERHHVSALARTSTIVGVDLRFPVSMSRSTDLSDPPGWATVQQAGTSLEIDDGGTSYLINPSEFMEFKFTPTTPSPGSPTDTTWHIVRWTEIAQ
ncbi:MAG TPA: hypothetical protein VK527_07410 [Candidatus Limnocylindrales bacterium]|nr:hypothetical protein [Candidatus Limnocylindrales bacterium]